MTTSIVEFTSKNQVHMRQRLLSSYCRIPTSCPHCNLKFTSLRSLSNHLRWRHKDLPRFCYHCGIKLTSENQDIRSLQKNHLCKICGHSHPERDTHQSSPDWQCRMRKRMQILEILGNKCVRCGNTDYRCLQVDHIKGDGWKDRKIGKRHKKHGNDWLFEQIKKDKTNYQILCANCNSIKKYENKEWARKGYRPFKKLK